MATNALNVTALDFDSIKESLKTFLKSQDQFRDYDFEGSGMSVLLDVLAYNTHYQAYYANMVANETFLDSAVLRPSAVSIAKHLDYVPTSYKPAIAYVDVEFINMDSYPSILTSINNGTYYIRAGDRFSTNSGSRLFLFTCESDVQVKKENGAYFARNVEIKEGAIKTLTYVYDDTNQNTSQKFIIPDINVDTDSLDVRVSESLENNFGIVDTWTRVSDLNKLNENSQIYFLQQNHNLNYEIYFGDGILGVQPKNGNVIHMRYRVTLGPDANGIGKNETPTSPAFRYAEFSNTRTTLVLDENDNPSPTFGGSSLESIDSIKYYAPRNYQAQERAVTAEDYRTILAREYGEQAESVFVWGGEDNDPPIYGKVFVSIKPKNAEKLSQPQKLAIATNILKEHNVVSILPEIVDPDYLYLGMNVTVNYDQSKTALNEYTMAANIRSLLYLYLDDTLSKFDRNFYYSTFITYINTSFNPPVLNSNATLTLHKRLEPNLTTISSYTINFDNELYHPIDGYSSILSSSSFGYQDSTSTAVTPPNVDAFLDDDGRGNVRLYKIINGSDKVYLNETIGTIDYTTGKIVLTNFIPQYLSSPEDTFILLTVIPANTDILARRNQILLANLDDIEVTAVPQTLRYDPYSASGAPFVGNN